jgi:DNA-binding PadR family transcriptional regulator
MRPSSGAQIPFSPLGTEPGRTGERTVYTLTDQGLDALAQWARTPVHFTALKSEALLRLLVADLVGEPATRESLLTLRDDISDLLARLDETEAAAEDLPHRRKYLLLVTGFMRRLFQLHLDLVDEVERELDGPAA